jgi:hypothetical protein
MRKRVEYNKAGQIVAIHEEPMNPRETSLRLEVPRGVAR